MTVSVRHSKVAVFTGVGKSLDFVDVPVPDPGEGEVLVRVTACTICGSDLHTFTGRRSGPVPIVLGHEIIGTVAAIGDSNVNGVKIGWPGLERGTSEIPVLPSQTQSNSHQNNTALKIGDRVTWSIAASCGDCRLCNDDLPQKCDSLHKYGHEAFVTDPLSGGLGEYCVLKPGTRIVRLPDDLPDEVACPANCATATVAAAMRKAGDVKNRSVLVVGTGMLGLTTCAFASASGASEVVACDIDESRLRVATEFGATRLVQSLDGDTFDFVFEMSGNSAAVAAGFDATTIGGVVVLVGSVSPSKRVPVDPERIVRRLMTIHGVHNYKPDDLATAVEFLRLHHQRFPFADLVESSFALTEAQAAMEHAEAERPIRVVVRPLRLTN